MDLKPLLEMTTADLQNIRLPIVTVPNNAYSISELRNTQNQNCDPLLSGFTFPIGQMPPVIVTSLQQTCANFQPIANKYSKYYVFIRYVGLGLKTTRVYTSLDARLL